jgi:hypothetical protein
VLDWQKFARERLDLGSLDCTQPDDITVEIAGHLEDLCDDRRADGLSEAEALRTARDQVPDWNRLSRRIRRARQKGGMNDRTRQIWLPALASLTAANLLLMALSCASLQPRLVTERSTAWFPGLALMAGYVPWLVAQPLVGALGAWLSRRAGGGRALRLSAGLFPSIVMLACWGLFIPASAAVENDVWAMCHPAHLALGAFVCIAPPAMGLLFGSLPFLGTRDVRGPGVTSGRVART